MNLARLLSMPSAITVRRSEGRFSISAPKIGLSFKLLDNVIGVSLICVLATSAFVLSLQRQQLVDGAQAATNRLSTAIEASLEHAMLRNDRATIDQMVQAVLGQQSIEPLRILDPQGVVQVSSDANDVGKHLDYADPT